MAVLDRSSALPLWAQVEAHLRARLAAGELDEGFPTEADLVEEYGVSRPTVRHAIARLEQDNLVVRRRGDGTRVTDRALRETLAGPYSLAESITSSGLEEHSLVLAQEMAPIPRGPAAALGLEPGSEAVNVVRVRYAGDSPVSVDHSWIQPDLGRSLVSADLSSGSIYELVRRRTGVLPSGSREQMSPVNPGPEDRAHLHLRRGEAALQLERVVYAGARPIEHRLSLVRGDRYRLTATWGTVPI
ncbi:MAG: GntR family transcriptional regulator [Acidimicrobiia bacterium]